MDEAQRAQAALYGTRIRMARTAHDLTVDQLATRTLAYRQSIEAWESGTVPIPPQYLARIAHTLDLPVAELAAPAGAAPRDTG
jgi:transcriptional regulator with XRE-family HTH domain